MPRLENKFRISGRLNDADGNETNIVIRPEDVAGFEVTELNQNF